SAACVPGRLENSPALLFRNAHGGNSTFVDSHSQCRFTHITPDLTVCRLDLPDVVSRQRSVPRWHDVLRRPLENGQMSGLGGNGRDELNAGRPCPDDAYALAA